MNNIIKQKLVALVGVALVLGCADVEPVVEKLADSEVVAPEDISNVKDEARVPSKAVEAAPSVPEQDMSHLSLSMLIPRVDLTEKRNPIDEQDAAKKPFDIEGYYKVRSINSVSFSPDGRTILFAVTTSDIKKGKTETDIYMMGFDGRGHRQITRSEGYDSEGVWTPDGKSIVFVSARSGSNQLWRMPIHGGEPEQLTDFMTEAGSPVMSPDGKKVVFVSDVFPEYGADDDENAKLIGDIEASPTKAHIADNLLHRHWTKWADGKRSHIMVLDIASKKITDITPGDFESPVFSPGGGTIAFSPDSKEICFSSNREDLDAQAWTTNSDLWVAPVSGGEARCLTGDNKAYDGDPVYSPDGRYIAYRKQVVPGFESDKTRIALYDRESNTSTVITEDFDHSAGHIEWSKDSKNLIFGADDKGRHPLFKVDVQGGPVKSISHIPSVRDFAVSDDDKLAFTFNRIGLPVELYVSYAHGGSVGKLTRFNVDLTNEYDIRPAEEVWFDAPNGRKIHTYIVKPHGFDPTKKYPLVLNVHGGPQSSWLDSLRGDWQVYSAAGYVTAFPNPTGSTGFGQEFTNGISKDYGGKVYEDVMAVADGLAALDYVDEDRMGAMGWSYGGYMMNWILGQTDRFKAIASMMGIFDMESFHLTTEELWFPEWDVGGTPWDNPEGYAKWNPANHVKNMNTPTLIVTGEKDYRISYTQSLMLFTALRRRGVPARLVVFPNDGHWPNRVKSMPLYYAAHLDWFHRYLGGDPSPYDIKEMVRGRAF